VYGYISIFFDDKVSESDFIKAELRDAAPNKNLKNTTSIIPPTAYTHTLAQNAFCNQMDRIDPEIELNSDSL
jgi:hypothetical protein